MSLTVSVEWIRQANVVLRQRHLPGTYFPPHWRKLDGKLDYGKTSKILDRYSATVFSIRRQAERIQVSQSEENGA